MNTTKTDLQNTLNEIEFVLRQNSSRIGNFEDPNFTLGFISAKIERINNCEKIY